MTKYVSKVICSKHPELNGLRRTRTHRCAGCESERSKERLRKKREDPQYRAAENAKLAKARREKYANDPSFREKERERCRARLAAKRAAAKATPRLAHETSAHQTSTIALPVPPVV